MKDPKKIHDLILENIDLASVMEGYGVHFKHNPHLTPEVQFHCPFHGADTKPSARLYNETKSCFCWVCRKSWDVISFIMEKEGLHYRQSLIYIANRYHVDLSSIPDDPTIELEREHGKIASDESFKWHGNVGILFNDLKKKIIELKKKIPVEKYKILCAVYFNCKFEDSKEINTTERLLKLEDKIICLKQLM